jgi:hypothetical protein
LGSPGVRAELRPSKAAAHRHRTVVLYHRGEAEAPAEAPDAHVGQEVTMKVIHDEALAGDPFHLREHVD